MATLPPCCHKTDCQIYIKRPFSIASLQLNKQNAYTNNISLGDRVKANKLHSPLHILLDVVVVVVVAAAAHTGLANQFSAKPLIISQNFTPLGFIFN